MRYSLLFLLFFSCSQGPPDDILPPGKMQAVTWDIIRADVFTTDFISKDSSANLALRNAAMQKRIFASHQVTKESFYKTYEYYLANPGKMSVLMDSIVARQTRENKIKPKPVVKDSMRLYE